MSILVFKKIWAWIKSYWYLPVVVVALLFVFVFRRTPNERLFEIIDKQRESYRKEVELINRANEVKEKRKEEIKEKHEEAIKNIEKEYNVEIGALEKEKKREISEVVKKHKEDPEALAREVAKILSSEYLKFDWEKEK